MRGRGTVAVIGAGPYGLAVAAHLRAADVPTHVFGDTLSFWRDHMPDGMRLRSAPQSSHIADPSAELTLAAWAAATGHELKAPLPLFDFIDYGHWFQRVAVPDVDPRRVRRVAVAEGGFRIELDDGMSGVVERVVVAAGIQPFASMRQDLVRLGRELVTHSSAHTHFRDFRDRRVAIIGCGQSALESAALLHEAGASVQVIARCAQPRWLPPRTVTPTDVGGGLTGWLSAAPPLWRGLPANMRAVIAERCIRPAAAEWLRRRLRRVPIRTGLEIQSARASHGGVWLDLTDGSQLSVHHVVLATGYDVNVRHYPFLDRNLVAALRVAYGYPILHRGLESSVRGLHFAGAPAAYSFGPVMHFVVGSWYGAPAIAAAIAERGRASARFWSFAPGAATHSGQLALPTSDSV
jgi:FAD-dependent urate hydroxylase